MIDLRTLIVSCGLLLNLIACGADQGQNGPEMVILNTNECTDSLLKVPVRVHLLSSTIEQLNSTSTEAQVRSHFAETNRIWNQACITFEIEQIAAAPLSPMQEENFRTQLSNNPPLEARRNIMRDAMPVDQLLTPGWNVMIFPQFAAPASGIYLTDIRSVLFAEKLPPMAPSGDNPSVILAHELGHSLGLRHFMESNKDQNLMNQEIMQFQNGIRLTSDQIMNARQQVMTGDTFIE